MSYIYGFFGTILSWFNSVTGSYALALLLFALLFKVIFLPFGIKTQKNQILMAKLRPKIAKIEKKYAGRNDRVTLQKKQQEIMELQQKEGYSMLSGCLPMLIQFPIIIFLYNVIRSPLSYICKASSDIIEAVKEVVGYTGTDEIALVDAINSFIGANGDSAVAATGLDVSLIPNFNLFGVNLAATPSFQNFSILILIPVLAAAFQWLSMFLMKKMNGNMQAAGADAQSQMSLRLMDLIFPLMTLFFAFNFSGMLGLYWIYQSIISILQQFILSKLMPLPTYTDEELKEMAKLEKERAAAQRATLREQPKVKSLHYIDDDDYDELPEVKQEGTKKTAGGLEISAPKDATSAPTAQKTTQKTGNQNRNSSNQSNKKKKKK